MFKELFKDYNEFKGNQLYFEVDDNVLDYYFYIRLQRQYANFEIAFDTPHDFYGAFWNIWEDATLEISKRKEIQDILITLSGDDYIKDTQVSTYAQNPNTAPRVPSELLNYFNTQNYSENNMKKVEAYARAYQLVPRGIVREFIRKFERLFMACINDNEYLYKRSNDNDTN